MNVPKKFAYSFYPPDFIRGYYCSTRSGLLVANELRFFILFHAETPISFFLVSTLQIRFPWKNVCAGAPQICHSD